MSRTVSSVVDILVARARQDGGIALTDDFATQLLTLCQQHINIALRRVTVTETLATAASDFFIALTELTTCAGILSVTEDNRALTPCTSLADFAAYELAWFANVTGTRFEAWTQLGRDWLVIYPAKAAISSVVVTSIKATTIYSTYSTLGTAAMELSDEDVDLALKLAEFILLTRKRKPAILKSEISAFIAQMGLKNDYLLKS